MIGIGGDAQLRVEAGLERCVELGEVLAQTELGVGVRRIDGRDLDDRRGQQALDVGHRGHEAAALRGAERFEERRGQLVAAALEHGPFRTSRGGELRRSDAPVRGARIDLDQTVRLERTEETAQVAGVEIEPRPQRPHIATFVADLPQHAGGAERSATLEEPIVEGADALRDGPIEAANLGDHRPIRAVIDFGRGHSLTLVREWR